jgi:UDP-N-acetylmuramoyl-L-alanyl-D-glutamate--2,6-diaminopimelate ligase
MGKIAFELSDRVVVTSDNPRTEDPGTIIAEILQGVPQGPLREERLSVEPDRRKAILMAIREAKDGDLVLIAGKGHEDYQILGTRKVHFDDREIALEALKTPTIT